MADVTVTPTLTISATAPATPAAGDLWWNSAIGVFFVYYDDGTSTQWVTTQPVKYINIAELRARAGGDFTGYYPDPLIEDAVALEYPVLRNPLLLGDYTQRLASTKWVTDMFASFGLLGQVTEGPGILLTPNPMAGDSTIALKAITPPLPVGEYGAANATAVFTINEYGQTVDISEVAIPPVNSPTFTGTPAAPHPSLGSDDTQIPTTQWVKDVVDATLIGVYAPLNSPVFTGDPRAPTPAATTDNDTSIATTAWVHNFMSFTQGSILFAGATTYPAQDNANLFWDDTNNRLGIGTNTPSTALHVVGLETLVGGTVAVNSPFLVASQTWNAGGVNFRGQRLVITNTASAYPSYPFVIEIGGADWFWIDQFGGCFANGGLFTSGNVTALTGTAPAAGGTTGAGILVSNVANFGHFWGTGAPTLSAARGSLYLRRDGTPYYNVNGTTQWAPIGGSVNVSDTAPVSPLDGEFWFNSALASLFIRYNDGNTAQWVPATPAPISTTVPVSNDNVTVFVTGSPGVGSATVAVANTGAIGHAGEKWQIEGNLLIGNTGAAATIAGVSIFDGTSVIADGGGVMGWATANWGVEATCITQIITLTGPTTFTLRATCNSGGGYVISNGAGGALLNRSSWINARRIA